MKSVVFALLGTRIACGITQVLSCLFTPAGFCIQPPKPKVAMANERVHTELLGERKRLAVVLLGTGDIRRVTAGADVAE